MRPRALEASNFMKSPSYNFLISSLGPLALLPPILYQYSILFRILARTFQLQPALVLCVRFPGAQNLWPSQGTLRPITSPSPDLPKARLSNGSSGTVQQEVRASAIPLRAEPPAPGPEGLSPIVQSSTRRRGHRSEAVGKSARNARARSRVVPKGSSDMAVCLWRHGVVDLGRESGSLERGRSSSSDGLREEKHSCPKPSSVVQVGRIHLRDINC